MLQPSRHTGPAPLLSPLKEEDEEVPEEAQRVNHGREVREQKEQDFGEVTASVGMMSIRGGSMEWRLQVYMHILSEFPYFSPNIL